MEEHCPMGLCVECEGHCGLCPQGQPESDEENDDDER